MHLPPRWDVDPRCWGELENEDQACSLPARLVAQQASSLLWGTSPLLWGTSPLLWGTGLEEVFQCNERSEQRQSVQKTTSHFKAKQEVSFSGQTCRRMVKTGLGKVSLNTEKYCCVPFQNRHLWLHSGITISKTEIQKCFQTWYIQIKENLYPFLPTAKTAVSGFREEVLLETLTSRMLLEVGT